MGNTKSKEKNLTLQNNLVFRDEGTKLEDHYDLKESKLGIGSKEETAIVRAESKHYTKSKRNSNDKSSSSKAVGYAVKLYKGEQQNSSCSQPDFKEEARLLQLCDHPNIIRLYGVNYSYSETTRTPQKMPGTKPKNVSLVLELCEGGALEEKFPFNAEKSKVIEEEAQNVIRQVMYAVAHMHHRNIIHRDIEITNIMYKSPPDESNSGGDSSNSGSDKTAGKKKTNQAPAQIKLIDFGCATQQIYDETKKAYLPLKEKTGPITAMAPEVVRGEYGPKCDIWSVGILTYNLLMRGKQVYVGKTNEEIEKKIKDGLFAVSYVGWRHSENGKDFIKKCLTRNDSFRPSAVEMMKHPWLRPKVSAEDVGLGVGDETVVMLPNHLLVSFQLYLQANQLKRIALNALAKNYTLLPEYQRIFYLLDTSFTGTLTKEEFSKAFNSSGFSSDEIDLLFVQMDMNQTGGVDYTEWVAGALEASGELEEDQIREAFDLLDEDRSGVITKKNLVKLLGGETSKMKKLISDRMMTKNDGGGKDAAARKLANEILEGRMKIEYDEFAQLFEFTLSNRCIDPILEASLNEEQLAHLRKQHQHRIQEMPSIDE